MQTSIDLSPKARHKARMEQRRDRYLNPPKDVAATYQPHPSRFEKPADRKLWDHFHKTLALECGVSVEDAVRLTSMRHGPKINRFNQWDRHGDEKQTTRRRSYRDSEAGLAAKERRDASYRTAVAKQSAAGIARMAFLAASRL